MIKVIKLILPCFLVKFLKHFLIKFKSNQPVHLFDVFGFDIYQDTNGLNYKKFVGKKLNDKLDSVDGRVFSTMKRYVSNGSVSIDVGASIGLMSLVMSKLVGYTGKVLSFEPDPVSFGLLRRNVHSNILNGNIQMFHQRNCSCKNQITRQ